jgi:hypothetical protein
MLRAKNTTTRDEFEGVYETMLRRELAQSQANPCAACLWRNPETCKQCGGPK